MREYLKDLLQDTLEYYILKLVAPKASRRITDLEYRLYKLETKVALEPQINPGGGIVPEKPLAASKQTYLFIWKRGAKGVGQA